MFYYIVQSHTSYFRTGLVKDESEFIVGPVETDLVRLTLVVAVSVDAYHFFGFLWDLTCQIDDTGISVFWLFCAAW